MDLCLLLLATAVGCAANYLDVQLLGLTRCQELRHDAGQGATMCLGIICLPRPETANSSGRALLLSPYL